MSDADDRPTRQPLNSVATKLILFVFLSTLATALIVSWISIQSTHTYLSGLIQRHYPAAMDRTAERALAYLRSGQSELEALAADGPFASAARGQGKALTRARKQLEAALEAAGHFEGLAVLAAKGRSRATAGTELGDELRSALVKDSAPGPHAVGSSPDEPSLFARVPLGSRRSPSGFLVGAFRRGALRGLLASELPDPGAVMRLVDADGLARVSSNAASPEPSRWSSPAAADDDSSALIHEYTNADGVHAIGGQRSFGLFGWSIEIETPFDAAFEPVLSVVTRIFVIDLCIILLFSYLAYRITTAIVNPIEVLSDAARRIAQGQLDLEIPEPDSHDEIGLLTRTFNDMMRKLRSYQSEIEEANELLTDQNHDLQLSKELYEQLAITDGLTKLHNHRFFQDHLTRELKRVNRVREPIAMLLIDLDDFKALNDRLGHAAGDDLLSGLARTMNVSVRESDLLARYGGEEFVVLTPNTDREGAYQLAEKLRTSIAEQSFILGDSLRPVRVTVSIGVAQFSGNRKKFFQAADRALYRAKAEGKNCVVADEEEII